MRSKKTSKKLFKAAFEYQKKNKETFIKWLPCACGYGLMSGTPARRKNGTK